MNPSINIVWAKAVHRGSQCVRNSQMESDEDLSLNMSEYQRERARGAECPFLNNKNMIIISNCNIIINIFVV